MSCGQTPRRWHDEPHRTRWRPIEQTARRLPRGFLWPRGDRGAPRSLMKPPSRGAWRCKRGRGRSLPLAVRTKRNAGRRGAPKPCSRPLSDDRHAAAAALDGKRKGVIGHSRSTCCGSARLAQASDGSPISTQLPHARPGRVMRTRGAVDRAVRARLVSMPCRVASRANGAKATAARHREGAFAGSPIRVSTALTGACHRLPGAATVCPWPR